MISPRALIRLIPLLILTAAVTARPARAETSPSKETPEEEAQTCLGCHEDPTLEVDLDNGEKVSLAVDPAALKRSVHGARLRCTDCHPGQAEIPHADRQGKTPAEFRAALAEACRKCHFDQKAKFLDSVHNATVPAGSRRPPTCLECHGSHEVTKPGAPRSRISRTCARCHDQVFAVYAKSVHGKALLEENNPDVPVCTDCHRAHDIRSATDRAWLLETPQLCGRCHSDPERMKKYGLSTAVVQTYLSDFHGVTASLTRAKDGKEVKLAALCQDCHGVHDIGRARDPHSPALKANLVRTCQRCHPDATENFPAAWMSHYEPSWQRYPLVYATRLFYAGFVPFVIGGLVLQILLHLWRVVANR